MTHVGLRVRGKHAADGSDWCVSILVGAKRSELQTSDQRRIYYVQRSLEWHCLTWIVRLLNEKYFVQLERRVSVSLLTIDLFQCIISYITSIEKQRSEWHGNEMSWIRTRLCAWLWILFRRYLDRSSGLENRTSPRPTVDPDLVEFEIQNPFSSPMIC